MARVMVCDEDKDFAGRLMIRLHYAGYEVVACKHAMDVVRDAARGIIDLIIFNLDMPGFGGSFGVGALREIAPHVPVIGISNTKNQTCSPVACVFSRSASPEEILRAVQRALVCSPKETSPCLPNADENLALR